MTTMEALQDDYRAKRLEFERLSAIWTVDPKKLSRARIAMEKAARALRTNDPRRKTI